MVGDSPFPDTRSVQFREVDHDSWVPEPGSFHTLLKIQPVTFPGFTPVDLNMDSDGVWLGQQITVAGYGTNSSDYNDTVAPERWSWPGQALETTLEVFYLTDDLCAASVPGLGPCRGTMLRMSTSSMSTSLTQSALMIYCTGDLGVPFLDQNNALVGIGIHPCTSNKILILLDYSFTATVCSNARTMVVTRTPGSHVDCGATNAGFFNFVRISHIADWLIHNVCALSDDRETLAFCPDLVCPADTLLMGYPWAELPDGSMRVEALHGFSPVVVSQYPPAGTPLWRNTTTKVTFWATDSLNRTLECIWRVTVPPLTELGEASLRIPPGNSVGNGSFTLTHGGALTGSIYKLKGGLQDYLRGAGSSISARLRKGRRGDQYGGSLKIVENRINETLRYKRRDPVDFSRFRSNDVRLEVSTQKNAKRNVATFKVFGQIQYAWF
jgi:hypothetical protein